jgi:hypothetical protein
MYIISGISVLGFTYSGWLLASTNLTDWRAVYQATNVHPYMRIVYGNGRFVVSGYRNAQSQNLALVSTNGRDWTEVSTDSVRITDIVFANDKFVALEGQSTNGLDWTFNSPQERSFASGLSDITFGGGMFVALDSPGVGDPYLVWHSGGGGVWTSTNGVQWTRRFVSPFTPWDVVYGNGTFVAVGEHTMIVQSANLASLVPIRLSGSITTQQMFNLTISSAAGLALTVEISSDLQSWQTFRTLVNESGQTNLLDALPAGSGRRFYRARTD